jgi:hypothetical protein
MNRAKQIINYMNKLEEESYQDLIRLGREFRKKATESFLNLKKSRSKKINNVKITAQNFTEPTKKEIKYKNYIKEEMQKVFFNFILKDFFEKNSNIESIKWEQYTPFFNDGEDCFFSSCAKEGSFYLNNNHIYACLIDNTFFPSYPEERQELINLIEPARNLYEIFKNIENNTFLYIFGEPSIVEIKKDGTIKIECLEHD